MSCNTAWKVKHKWSAGVGKRELGDARPTAFLSRRLSCSVQQVGKAERLERAAC